MDAAWRVSSTQVIPAQLLTYNQQEDADGLTNYQKLLILGSRVSSPFACVQADVLQGQIHRQTVITEDRGLPRDDLEAFRHRHLRPAWW